MQLDDLEIRFRQRHRFLTFDVVSQVVLNKLDKKQAQMLTKQQALKIPAEERAHFIEVIEIELMALHEGNIARYRLLPSEYEAWRIVWK